jgi:hypothetical protein
MFRANGVLKESTNTKERERVMPFPPHPQLHGIFFNIDKMDGCFYDNSYGLVIQVLPAPPAIVITVSAVNLQQTKLERPTITATWSYDLTSQTQQLPALNFGDSGSASFHLSPLNPNDHAALYLDLTEENNVQNPNPNGQRLASIVLNIYEKNYWQLVKAQIEAGLKRSGL